MRKLPHWVLTDSLPAFYDSESLTVLQQTAKLYAAMQELIEEYNQFAADLSNEMKALETETDAAIDYMQTNIYETTINSIERLVDDGAIVVKLDYNRNTEELNLSITK